MKWLKIYFVAVVFLHLIELIRPQKLANGLYDRTDFDILKAIIILTR